MPINLDAVHSFAIPTLIVVSAGRGGSAVGAQAASEIVQAAGRTWRGIGHSMTGAGGPPPPTRVGAVSTAQADMLARAHASAIDTHPGVQGTQANPPRGRHVDVRV